MITGTDFVRSGLCGASDFQFRTALKQLTYHFDFMMIKHWDWLKTLCFIWCKKKIVRWMVSLATPAGGSEAYQLSPIEAPSSTVCRLDVFAQSSCLYVIRTDLLNVASPLPFQLDIPVSLLMMFPAGSTILTIELATYLRTVMVGQLCCPNTQPFHPE